MPTDDFNPYQAWLGLEPTLTQPNHYQLLGLDPQERDPARISAAADTALSQVRAFRPGAQSVQWAKLLNEINAARKCLSDPGQRASYDRRLAERGAAGAMPHRPPPRRGGPEQDTSAPSVPMSAPVPAVPMSGPAMPAAAPPGPPGSGMWNAPAAGPAAYAPGQPSPMAYGYGQAAPPTAYAPPESPPAYPAPPGYGTPMPMTSAWPGAPAGMPPASPYGPATPVPPSGFAGPMPPGQYAPAMPPPIAGAAPVGVPGVLPPGDMYAPPKSASPRPSPAKRKPVTTARNGSGQVNWMPILLAAIGIVAVLIVGLIVAVVLSSSRTGDRGSPQAKAPPKPSHRGKASEDGPMFKQTAAQKEAARHGVGQTASPGSAKPSMEKPTSAPIVTEHFNRQGKERKRRDAGPESTADPFNVPPTTLPADLAPPGETKKPEPASGSATETDKPATPTDANPVMAPKPGTTPDPAPKSEPETPAKPSSETAKSPAESPPPTRNQVATLAKALTAARKSLVDGKPDVADRKLEEVRQLPKLPEHEAMYARLCLLVKYSNDFRTALSGAISKLEKGDQIPFGNSTVSVVEVSATEITLKIAGGRQTFPVEQPPVGLVLGIAEELPKKGDPLALVYKATYVATHKDAQHLLPQARGWFQQAAQKGADIGDLAKVLDDKYDLEADLK